MGQKLALIIATADYQDEALARLRAPGLDAHDFAGALQSPDIGAFDSVQVLLNEAEPAARRSIARFFAGRRPDDLLLLYFSGHGVRDEQGQLYLAVTDTDRSLLSATAIAASFVNAQMNASRSRRQVLILDCCNSGAFAHGSKGGTGGSMGIATAFEGTGYGRVVLTATDATQYAWEGDEARGEAANSVFTHYLVKGLETGAADADGDGRITLDELYEYVYEQVVVQTPRQTPGKFAYNQQGELVIARNPRPAARPAALPPELRQAVESPLMAVREAAVRELEALLRGSHSGLVLAAVEALERLAADDSRRVSAAAGTALAAHAAAAQQQAQLQAAQQEAAAALQRLRDREKPKQAPPIAPDPTAAQAAAPPAPEAQTPEAPAPVPAQTPAPAAKEPSPPPAQPKVEPPSAAPAASPIRTAQPADRTEPGSRPGVRPAASPTAPPIDSAEPGSRSAVKPTPSDSAGAPTPGQAERHWLQDQPRGTAMSAPAPAAPVAAAPSAASLTALLPRVVPFLFAGLAALGWGWAWSIGDAASSLFVSLGEQLNFYDFAKAIYIPLGWVVSGLFTGLTMALVLALTQPRVRGWRFGALILGGGALGGFDWLAREFFTQSLDWAQAQTVGAASAGALGGLLLLWMLRKPGMVEGRRAAPIILGWSLALVMGFWAQHYWSGKLYQAGFLTGLVGSLPLFWLLREAPPAAKA